MYTLNLLAFKLSLLASYFRIGGFVALYRTIIVISIAICVVTQLIYTFIIVLSCQPVSVTSKDSSILILGLCQS